MPAPYTAFTYGLGLFNPVLQAFGTIPQPYPWWPQFTFANGVQGIAYAQQFTPGGDFPLTVTLQSGSLPTGLSLSVASDPASSSLFQIAGTPSVAGAFPFTLRATNSNGYMDQSFTITIISAATAYGGVSTCFAA